MVLQASSSLTDITSVSFAILTTNEFLLQKQSYGNAIIVMSFPLQHFENVSVRFLECPPQPFPFLQTTSLYMLLQMAMCPAVSAVILGNLM